VIIVLRETATRFGNAACKGEVYPMHIHNFKSAIPEELLISVEQFVLSSGFKRKVSYGVGENTHCEKIILDPAHLAPGSLDQRIFKDILTFLSELTHKFIIPLIYPLSNPSFEVIELRRMLGPTRAHTDGVGVQATSIGISYRIASMILTLSDSSDKIVFPAYNTTIALNRGDVLVFPSYWTHEHFTVSKAPGRISLLTHLREVAPENNRPETGLLRLDNL